MEEFGLQDIGRRIQAVRKTKKKTQDEVAEAIGITKKTISEWERGLKQPGLLNILHFCKFLGITVDELLELQPSRTLHLELSEGERDSMLARLDDCHRAAQNSPENTPLHRTLHGLERQIAALFGKAQSQ